jgi:hypothetical protein
MGQGYKRMAENKGGNIVKGAQNQSKVAAIEICRKRER